ncbi:MAG: hypothetical protein RLZZ242_40 [Bacteroidota bacterium]|jgi:shikimate kinase
MKIVLLGYMGSGKSTIGQALSDLLNLPFKDLDEEIARRVGMPVSKIFDQKGEVFFRKKEAAVLQELLDDSTHFILALGGGTPCYGSNMDLIEETPGVLSIYLKASVAELTSRLSNGQQERPLLYGRSESDLAEFIGKHLFERMPFYERADHSLAIASKTPKEIVNEINKLLEVR